MKKRNILVTGCGGDIGQSVGKILNELNQHTFGLDISDKNAAQFVFTHFEIGPKVSDENYLEVLEKYVLKNNIEMIIPVSEHELRFYTEHYKETPFIGGAVVLMANLFSRKIGFNKTKTALFLKDKHLPNPKLYSLESTGVKFPILAKPNTGAGSASVFIVENFEEFKYLHKKHENLIFQELLDGTAGEFTCCVYQSKKQKTETIIFKRELTSGGYSGYGEVVEDQKIENLLLNLAKLLELEGSINVQLRIHNGLPVVFEINPRFSSTVLFRHLLGFKDLEWCINEFFGEENFEYKKPAVGKCFYKGFNEYIA